MKTNSKIRGLIGLLLIFAGISYGYVRLYLNQKGKLETYETARSGKPALLLDKQVSCLALEEFLMNEGYCGDQGEASFIASHIVRRIKEIRGNLPSLNVLAKRDIKKDFAFYLNDSTVRSGLMNFPKSSQRVLSHEFAKGVNETTEAILADSTYKNPEIDADGHLYRIRILEDKPCGKFLRALFHPKKKLDDPVVIRITQHWREEVPNAIDYRKRDSVLTYIRAVGGRAEIRLRDKDEEGHELYYSVLPVQRGYSFGTERATYRCRNHLLSFTRRPDYIMPLSTHDLQSVRESGKLVVRTPEQYRSLLFSGLGAWLLLWLVAFIIILLIDKRRNRTSNYTLVVILAGLTGMGLLTLFSISYRPLQDSFYAWSQMRGLVWGICGMLICCSIRWDKMLTYNPLPILARGLVAAFAAVSLLLLAWAIGWGPGGSHVNILWGIQPSAATKYLVIIAVSLLLVYRKPYIQEFALSSDKYAKRHFLAMLMKAITLIIIVMAFQILCLKDMGPGVVITLSSVILYCLLREDVPFTILWTGLFAAALIVAQKIGGTYTWALATIIWLIMWWTVSRFSKGKVSESTVLIATIVIAILFSGSIFERIPGLEEQAARMSTRVESHQDPFDNRSGSDQLARSIWAMTEGFTGNPGNTMVNTLPAAHTDFIYPSVVSGFGAVGGIILLVLLFAFVVEGFRSATCAKNEALFFILAGITITVSVQGLFILGGCTNLLILSGLPIPFVSYGSTHLILDLMAAGLLIGSNNRDYAELSFTKQRSIIKQYGVGIVSLIILCGFLLACVAAVTVRYSICQKDDILVKPAIVSSPDGDNLIEYSPQIEAVKEQLQYGRAFDRNGVLLAKPVTVGKSEYPLGDALFFWTGYDYSKALWSGTNPKNPYGVLAAPRYLSYMRGFDNEPHRVKVTSHYQRSPFMPSKRVVHTDTLMQYNYSVLLPFINDPALVDEFNQSQSNRDIYLSVDSDLQLKIIEAAQTFFINNVKSLTSQSRVTAVIIDAATGDVLATPCWPGPNIDRILGMAENKQYVYKDDLDGFQAFAHMDLAMYPTPPGSIMKLFVAVAGLRRIGPDMEQHTEVVYLPELIYHRGDTRRTGRKTLKGSLRESNNIYFIKTLNNLDLYGEYGRLCWECGVPFDGLLPYGLYSDEIATNKKMFDEAINKARTIGLDKWAIYKDSGEHRKLNDHEWGYAWGQSISASPLFVARLVGAIGNGGVLMESRFCSKDSIRIKEVLLTEEEAGIMQSAMQYQAKGSFGLLSSTIGAKTGTPERAFQNGKMNDAWHTFFILGEETTNKHPIAVCVRLERVNATSSIATDFSKEILKILHETGMLVTL